jgi:hypothetical protein
MNARRNRWIALAATAVAALLLGIAAGCASGLDLSDLEKWQTSIAAIVALAAATLAYLAAMAKVRLDEDIAAETLRRKKLGLFTRLEFALDRLHEEAYGREGLTEKGPIDRKVTLQQMRIAMPPELEEAWRNLEMFPRPVVEALAAIRTNIRDLKELQDRETVEEFVVPSGNKTAPSTVHATNRIMARMASHCLDAEQLLMQELELQGRVD